MSADLVSDPAIFATYHELRNPDSALNWLFLGYSATGSKDRLELADSGDSGLEGLKAALSHSNALNIHFALLRLEGRFLLITLLPDNTGGVKRARALVHSRAVGTKLQHQATLTVARPSDLTINAVRSKLKLDTGSASSSLPSSPNPQLSAGTSVPSPLQPSPLRSHFPSSQVYSSTQDGTPPPPPDKDDQSLLRMRSSNSLRTPQMANPPFSPPMRQSSREANNHISPGGVPSSPPIGPVPAERMRQPSIASSSSANTPAPVGLGLVSSAPLQSQHNDRSAIPQSSSVYSNTSVSPRLASSEFDGDASRAVSQNGPSSPVLPSIPEGSTRLTPGSTSPSGSISSRISAKSFRQAQNLPLPLSASPSVPTSARSLEASTLDRMFRPSESVESLDNELAEEQNNPPRSSPTQAERVAVAEAIARAAEAKWQANRSEPSADGQGRTIYTETSSTEPNTTLNTTSAGDHQALTPEDPSPMGRTHNAQQDTESSVKETLRLQAQAELSRLEEEARKRARAQEEAEEQRVEASRRQEEAQAEADRQKREEEAEAERSRLAKEAEGELRRAESEAEAARQRAEAEAEATRQREEAEAEAERQRKQAEEEADRQRQEAEAAAEAERIRIEESRLAEEKARLKAIEIAKREKEEARQRAFDDLRDRIRSSTEEVALTGFLSVQGGTSILWRRRHFQMTGKSLKLYKNDKETMRPVDEVMLGDNIKRVEKDAEDLIAIPHSFKLIFKDYDEEPYLFYCDEEDDKDLLLVGLRAAASLD